jgi:hypothetical protein
MMMSLKKITHPVDDAVGREEGLWGDTANEDHCLTPPVHALCVCGVGSLIIFMLGQPAFAQCMTFRELPELPMVESFRVEANAGRRAGYLRRRRNLLGHD